MTINGKFGDPKTERDILSAKRFNFLALLVLIGAIASAFLLYLQLLDKQQQLELKSTELADSTENLRRIRGELEAAQGSLAAREQQIENQLQSLSSSVENRHFDSAMVQAKGINEQLARHDSAGLTLVQLYAWQPQAGILPKIKAFLAKPDYIIAVDSTLSALPEWMGKQSAVYFYESAAREKATTIATRISKITGRPFVAVAGNAQDAPQGGHHIWLRIDYLGNPASGSLR